MKQNKKIASIFVTVLVFISLSINSYAAGPNLPNDFKNMSIQQRIQWIDGNFPANIFYMSGD